MVSSSPPPLDDEGPSLNDSNGEEEEEEGDDFGDFACAGHINSGNKSFNKQQTAIKDPTDGTTKTTTTQLTAAKKSKADNDLESTVLNATYNSNNNNKLNDVEGAPPAEEFEELEEAVEALPEEPDSALEIDGSSHVTVQDEAPDDEVDDDDDDDDQWEGFASAKSVPIESEIGASSSDNGQITSTDNICNGELDAVTLIINKNGDISQNQRLQINDNGDNLDDNLVVNSGEDDIISRTLNDHSNVDVIDVVDDDDDEFTDFVVSSDNLDSSREIPNLFADFQVGGAAATSENGGSDAWAPPEENFAEFSAFNDADDSNNRRFGDVDNEEDDDSFSDFGEFETAAEAFHSKDDNNSSKSPGHNLDSAGSRSESESVVPPLASVENPMASGMVDKILSIAFPKVELPGSENDHILGLDDVLIEKTNSYTYSTKSAVWANLCDVENTNALTYQWSQSQSSKRLMQSLNIDSRNILLGTRLTSSTPLFAANMSFDPLEPLKMEPANGGTKESRALPVPQGSDVPQESIPPAQFDWNCSGLVNPLDGLETELLHTDTTSQSNGSIGGGGGNGGGPKTSPLLEKILADAKMMTSSLPQQRGPRPKNLSLETQAVLDLLPDLSFMRSKVLMFPIRSASP